MLGPLGIRTAVDLPGVGANLQDHLEVYIQYACSQPVTMQPYLASGGMPGIGAQWLLGRRGPAATNHFEGGGFARSNGEVAYPNLMFHFLPIAVRYDGSVSEQVWPPDTATRCTSARCIPTPGAPVRIVSTDP